MKRQKKGKTPTNKAQDNAAVDASAADTVVAAVETNEGDEAQVESAETVEPVLDEEVLAMLAGDENEAGNETASDEPQISEDDVPAPTDDEVLAAIDSADTGKKKGSGQRKAKTPAAPIRAFTAVAQIDDAALKTNLDGINAKKVREKAENLIAAVERGTKLSRYTRDAVKHLKAQGRVSGKTLADMFQAEGLSLGTARAQSQQMTALFRAVGLAAPEAGSKDLVLADNDLAEELVKIAA